MRDRFDVAVVGGGVVGLAVARALRLAGVDRVVVLEREPSVGQGSSARANGGVRAQFTSPINIAFSLHSIAEFEDLRRDYEDLLSFHQTGYLFLTGAEEGERGLRSAMELQRSLGVDVRWIEPNEIARLAPIVETDGLRGGTFHERDGFLDPHGTVEVMRQECRRLGAEVRTDAGVRDIRPADGSFEITAASSDIVAEHVVNAAGPHARQVGALVGVDVPVEPVRRNIAFASDPGHGPALIPMCIDVETGVLIRRELGGGYVLCYANPQDPPGWDTSVDPRFLEDLASRIGNRFPRLEDVPLDPRHCWAGLYPETTDHHAIVGGSDVPGFWLAVGFGGHGLMHAPAASRAIAELVTSGECTTFDLHALRLSRFAEGDLTVETAVL